MVKLNLPKIVTYKWQQINIGWNYDCIQASQKCDRSHPNKNPSCSPCSPASTVGAYNYDLRRRPIGQSHYAIISRIPIATAHEESIKCVAITW